MEQDINIRIEKVAHRRLKKLAKKYGITLKKYITMFSLGLSIEDILKDRK